MIEKVKPWAIAVAFYFVALFLFYFVLCFISAKWHSPNPFDWSEMVRAFIFAGLYFWLGLCHLFFYESFHVD